jgi:formyl-CoA transferase/CoA:oxalate CoA-transferase
MQGLGGLMGVTGEPGGLPTKVGVAITDIGSGMFAAYGIVLALMARGTRKFSHGQHIDISMLDAQVAWLTYMAGYFFATGKDPEKIGAAHPNLVPYQAFLCGDGKFINVAVGSQRLWERFCEGIDRKDLFDHSDFRQNSDRVTNKSRLLPILETEFSKKTMAQWVSKLENHGVPCGPINLISDIFSDPQVIHRNMLLDISHSTIGSIKQTGIPIKFSKTPGSIYRPPPTLGQHTNEILAGLGYRADQIKLLKKQGVI